MALPVARSRESRSHMDASHPRHHLIYLDNMKILLVAGIILAHAATHYIGDGAWLDGGSPGQTALIVAAGAIGLVGSLFWIGLFFLIAGLLAPGSLNHKRVAAFLRDRFMRLGIPFVLFVTCVMPLLRYVSYVATYTGRAPREPFLPFIGKHLGDFDPGPLWFVADLLLFSTMYAIWWTLRPHRPAGTSTLRSAYLVLLVTIIAGTSLAAHLVWPLFTRQYLDLHLSQWPQYIFLFWFGALSAERGWLKALPDRLWKRCGWAALTAALVLPLVGIAPGSLSGDPPAITGGWHWQALAMSGIEGTLAVAGSLWMLECFRRWLDRETPLTGVLARSSYAAFIVHDPWLVIFALALLPLGWPLEVSFLVLALATTLASFGSAWLLVIRLHIGARFL